MKSYKTLLAENRAWAEETFKKIDSKMSEVTIRSRDKIVDGVDEKGFHKEIHPAVWTSGFWGGLNWLLYNYTKNENYKLTAESSEKLMDEALSNFPALHHDVGFMWHLVCGASYSLTGNSDSKTRNLFAAASLFSRFVMDEQGGGFIRAWNGWGWDGHAVDDWSIIDCLMNIPLLYWASRELNDDRFKRVAMAHADMAIDCHLRPDGSVAHIVEHNRADAHEVVKTYGGQGIEVGSSWSRGQSWALYGFTLSYIHTGEERYLNAAKQVANYFIANCCDDWLPRVDFRSPEEPVYYDSTAGACAACGLLELAKRLPENEGGMYAHAAIKMLKAMGERFCDFDPANDHMLGYGSVRYPTDEKHMNGMHISIIYGDYFYTEAVLKLLGEEFLAW